MPTRSTSGHDPPILKQITRQLFQTGMAMAHHLVRVDPGSNAYRFYRLALWPDLFGDVSLAREWGRIGQPGKLRLDRYDSEQAAGQALERLAAVKRRRGYRPSGAGSGA